MVGICGDSCPDCPLYIATRNGSAIKLDEVKELWVRLSPRDPSFPVKDMVYLACKPENNCSYSEVRACVQRREIENCGLCKTYPCNLITAAFEKSAKLCSRFASVSKSEELNILDKAFS